MMHRRVSKRMKDRRDIGGVVFPIEKMLAARQISPSCVGVEALLEIDAKSIARTARRDKSTAS